eukprot:191157_1
MKKNKMNHQCMNESKNQIRWYLFNANSFPPTQKKKFNASGSILINKYSTTTITNCKTTSKQSVSSTPINIDRIIKIISRNINNKDNKIRLQKIKQSNNNNKDYLKVQHTISKIGINYIIKKKIKKIKKTKNKDTKNT